MTVSTDIRRGLSFAGLIILVAGGAKLAAAYGIVGGDWPERALMATIGVFLMVTGNAIPKTLAPLSSYSPDVAAVQRLQRQAGWAFTIAGAGLAIGWVALPEPLANLLTLLLAPITATFLVQMFRVCRVGRAA
jgi:hypothetical protein